MMIRRTWRWAAPLASLGALLLWGTMPATGQAPVVYGTQNGEWQTYGGDLKSTRYSPLDQVNAGNFNKLEVAWRFKTDKLGPRPEFNLQTTPLMVKNVLYFTGGTRRAVAAVDAVTGEMLWMHSENEGKRGEAAPRQLSGRGVAYWTDGRNDSRIIYVTPGYQMVALDAKTGETVKGFGRNGLVDLKLEDDQQMDLISGEIGLHSAPIIVNDVIIIGAAHLAGGIPKSKTNQKGYVRGYDAKTGKRLWIFHTIPLPGEFGNDTWEKDSWSYTGNTGSWAQMTADPELGLIYVPVELPTGDYYGGHRPGNGLFGESLVALDVKTGKRKWHYQLVHHGMWDNDIPCAPILADINVNGRAVKAIAQATKQGWVYVFDRTNGQPVWPIEERPVPKGDVPGEWYSPTQPYVTKPPPFERMGVTEDDLIDFTPALREEAKRIASNYKMGPYFTPPVVSTWPGPLGTLVSPVVTGGANWQGGSLDPETNFFYIFSNSGVQSLGLVKSDGSRSDMDYIQGTARNPNAAPPSGGRGGGGAAAGGDGEGGGGLTVQGLPLLKPPYARITALDLNKGELVWQIAHGETADNIKNNPALKGVEIPRTGRQGRIGVLTTKTLVIAGEGGFFTAPNGQRGAMLRAYDKATGKEVGAVYMAAPQTGSPMTYMAGGKQYITVSISGPGYSGEVVAYRLGN
ncbi:MAG: PQQ-binding-like beta-propeller repeat protein [Acidobacteriaceae bacterium]|jgi:quinoprotein glucose dehydrogenase|nr:PQQ-binding-like beta-propeller repeat protein [Acidobacteriaceae bacterium]